MGIGNFQALVLLHEFLHYRGIVSPDKSGKPYTFPNGDKAKGSMGISQEVKKKCFNWRAAITR